MSHTPSRVPRHPGRHLPRMVVVLACAVLLWAGERPALATDGWVSPVGRPLTVLRGFEPPALRWLAGHRGVDLAAAPGSAVLAAGAGVVTFAAALAGRGVVVVRHGSLRTTYEPVTAGVAEGTVVVTGQQLGTVEPPAAHCAGRSCLHWGLLRGSTYLDPLALLGLTPVRLLPLPPAPAEGGAPLAAERATGPGRAAERAPDPVRGAEQGTGSARGALAGAASGAVGAAGTMLAAGGLALATRQRRRHQQRHARAP